MRHNFYYNKKGEFLKTKIQITKVNIKKGKPLNVQSCPIALAIKRTLKATNLYVADIIDFTIKNKIYTAGLPIKAIDFIEKFDTGHKVKPFSFILKGEFYKEEE